MYSTLSICEGLSNWLLHKLRMSQLALQVLPLSHWPATSHSLVCSVTCLTSHRVNKAVRHAFRNGRALQVALLLTVVVATAMVVGDGILTPSISVLGAVSGLQVATDGITQGEQWVPCKQGAVACMRLVVHRIAAAASGALFGCHRLHAQSSKLTLLSSPANDAGQTNCNDQRYAKLHWVVL